MKQKTPLILTYIVVFVVILLPKSTLAENSVEFFFKSSQQYQDVVVQEVISADTIVIENFLKRGERIKLIGLKAPEPPRIDKTKERDKYGFVVRDDLDPADPIEETALNFAKELLEGKRIRVEFDSNKVDDNLVTLGYVFLKEDDLFVNIEILKQGYANLTIQPPNTKYAKELRKAYQEARREKRGLQGF